MTKPAVDIYFLVFASMVIFSAFLFFIIIVFNSYRRRQRRNLVEKEEMKTMFREELLRSQLEIQEQTFNHISQEIHDNVGQMLSLVKVQVNIIKESEMASTELLDDITQNVGKAMSDLRDIAKSLSSERIKMLDIHDAIENEAERLNKSGIIHARLCMSGGAKKIAEQKKLILFRIVQECLQNIIKHACAQEVTISLDYHDNNVEIVINDNGKGFDFEAAIKNKSGLGLTNMQTRARLAGGNCILKSESNSGTNVLIIMPYA